MTGQSTSTKIKKNTSITKNLASLGNILKKSLADPLTHNDTIPEIQHELKAIKRIDRLFKPRKNKNWYFLKYMPFPQQARFPATTIDQSKTFGPGNPNGLHLNKSIESTMLPPPDTVQEENPLDEQDADEKPKKRDMFGNVIQE